MVFPRRSILIALFTAMLVAGCDQSPTVTSGAGSSSLCERCTDVIFTNRTRGPVMVSISRKELLLRPAETKTVHFDAFKYRDEVGYVVFKTDTSGVPFLSSEPQEVRMRGGTIPVSIEEYIFN